MMSRIAFISTVDSCPWGGSEELWSRTALHLLHEKNAVAACVKWWPEPVPQIAALERAGCYINRRPPASRKQHLLSKFAPERAFRWIDEFKPNLVVISQGHQIAGLEWMQACARRKIPYVLVVQAAGECWWPGDDVLHPLRDGFLQAKSCYFVSRGNLDLVTRQFGVPLPAAKVVYNPFNVDFDAQVAWPQDKAIFKLACVGRLEPYAKGQDILFQVLREEKWRGRPLTVTLFGNGPNRNTIESLRQMWGLQNVSFGGFISDITALWAEHHALVLPSCVEGLPLAVVEAMLCARPCILTDVAGNTELVEDGVSGYIAAAPTCRMLDDAMERAWNHRHEWREMGVVAAQRVRHMVPRDPAGVFADELKTLIADGGK